MASARSRAGGDIRALYDQGKAGQQKQALEFFAEEYSLNNFIKRYPKPYVSLIDGIVMGGGVGISIHGSHRVAGDKYQFAMPEVGIGFFPDVGATWALPRLPGEIGTYLALTGERLKTADGVATGAATHHVRSDRFADLRDALCGAVPVDAVLAAFAEPAGEGRGERAGAGDRPAVRGAARRGDPDRSRSRSRFVGRACGLGAGRRRTRSGPNRRSASRSRSRR